MGGGRLTTTMMRRNMVTKGGTIRDGDGTATLFCFFLKFCVHPTDGQGEGEKIQKDSTEPGTRSITCIKTTVVTVSYKFSIVCVA